MRVQNSIDIAAPPEKIWPFLVEPEKILKWCITFKKFEYLGEQRGGVGTPVYVEEKAGPTPLMKLNFAVTEWNENESLALNMTSGSGVKSYQLRCAVMAIPSGSRFMYTEEVEMPFGFMGKLLGIIGQRSAESHVKEMLAKLKSLAEA
jgi:uncharacterized protein YndB with AHSA1/START domain